MTQLEAGRADRAAVEVVLGELAGMERWMRVLAQARPEPIAVGAAALSAALVVGAFAAALLTDTARIASVAAAGAFLLLIAIGVSLYAWRLGVPGRSD